MVRFVYADESNGSTSSSLVMFLVLLRCENDKSLLVLLLVVLLLFRNIACVKTITPEIVVISKVGMIHVIRMRSIAMLLNIYIRCGTVNNVCIDILLPVAVVHRSSMTSCRIQYICNRYKPYTMNPVKIMEGCIKTMTSDVIAAMNT